MREALSKMKYTKPRSERELLERKTTLTTPPSGSVDRERERVRERVRVRVRVRERERGGEGKKVKL